MSLYIVMDLAKMTVEAPAQACSDRRAIYETEVKPLLRSASSCELGILLNKMEGRLNQLITQADEPQLDTPHPLIRRVHLYVKAAPGYGGQLYLDDGSDLAISFVFGREDPKVFNQAVEVLLNTVQGEVPLKPINTWQETVGLYEWVYGRTPEPFFVCLPTKVPGLFLNSLYENLDGVVSRYPRQVSLQVSKINTNGV